MQEAEQGRNKLLELINEFLDLNNLRNVDIRDSIYIRIFEVIQNIIEEVRNRVDIDKEKLDLFQKEINDVLERYKEMYPTDINSHLDELNEEFEKKKIGGIFPIKKYEHRTNPEIPILYMGPTLKELQGIDMVDDFFELDENYKKERELAEDVERLIDYTKEFINVVNPVNNEVQTVEKTEIVPKRKNKFALVFSNLSQRFFNLLRMIKLGQRKDKVVATIDAVELRPDGLEIISERQVKEYLKDFSKSIYNREIKTKIIKGENAYFHTVSNGKNIIIAESLHDQNESERDKKTIICDEKNMHQLVGNGDNISYFGTFLNDDHLVEVEIQDMNGMTVTISEGHKNYIKCTSRLDKITIKDNKTNNEETKDMWHVIFERIDKKKNKKKIEMYYDSKEDYIRRKGPRIVKGFEGKKDEEYIPRFEYILLENGEYKGIGFENDGNEVSPVSYQFTYDLDYVKNSCEQKIRCSEAQKISRIGTEQGINGFLPEDLLNIFEKIQLKYAEKLKKERNDIESKRKGFLNKLEVQKNEANLQAITKEEFEEQINSRKTAYSKASKPDGKSELKSVKLKDYHKFYQFDDSIIADKTNGKNNTDTIICCGDSKFYRIAFDERSIEYEEYEKYNDPDLDFRHCFIREPLMDKYGVEYLKYKTQGFGKVTEYSFEEERKDGNESERKCNIEVHCTKIDNDKLPDKEKIEEKAYIQYDSKRALLSGEMPIKIIAQNNSTKLEDEWFYDDKYKDRCFEYNKEEDEWDEVPTMFYSYKFEDVIYGSEGMVKNIDPRIVNVNIIQGGIKSIIPDRVLEILKKIHPEVVIKLENRKKVKSQYWESKHER